MRKNTYLRGTPEERFWPKVNKAGPISKDRPDLGPCWIWTAGLTSNGYGSFHMKVKGRWRPVRAHRFAYESLVGRIPKGLEPDHLCRVRACVNPSHLEPVTRRENFLRGSHPHAAAHNDRTCTRGHPMSEENTYYRIDRPGEWNCRVCRRERDQAKAAS